MISFGRWGKYKGRSYFFTHRNPKNGDVWSDDIPIMGYSGGKYVVITYGMWVPTDKVEWEKPHKKGA